MTFYAQYNPAITAPSPVIGWYDSDMFHYPNLPALTELLVVTQDQWNARLSNPSGWAVSNDTLVAYTPPAPVLTLAQQANILLTNGLAITCPSNSALNATYDTSSATLNYMNSEMNSIIMASTFADGTTSLEWPDMAGALHNFSIPEFKSLYIAINAFVAGIRKCINGVSSATLPSSLASI